ncbi:MAG: DUF4349 domain-containing protein [Clostridia bacterium]|nr:DUF4349 domain-containing protein [Clostridia bacterium]
MKKLSVLSLALALALVFSACGAAKSVEENAAMDADIAVPQSKGESASFYSLSYGASADMKDIVMEEDAIEYAAGSVENGSLISSDNALREEKLVYTSNVTLETENFEEASNTLHNSIKQLGGIIISENARNLNNVNSDGMRSLYMSVKIPQTSYDTFLSGLNENYNVASIQNNVDNLTDYYYDNENRLKSYRIQEERLFAMLEKADTVSDMLEIEARLCDVQYEIEALTNTQKTIDNDVKYATFHLNLHEVTKFTSPAPRTFGDRLSDTIKNSGEGFVEFLEDALFVIILIAPYLVIFAVGLVIAIVIVKHRKKKTSPKKEENKDEK